MTPVPCWALDTGRYHPESFRGYRVHETSTRRTLEKFVQRIGDGKDWPG